MRKPSISIRCVTGRFALQTPSSTFPRTAWTGASAPSLASTSGLPTSNTGAFVKNAGLGFAIPYLHNGEPHDFEPDFIVRLNDSSNRHLIIETKGYDPLAEVKQQAAAGVPLWRRR